MPSTHRATTLRRSALVALVWSWSFTAGDAAAQTNPIFTPSWVVGDAWDVEYTLAVPNKSKEPIYEDVLRVDVAHYTVIDKVDMGGELVFAVRVALRDSGQVLTLKVRESDFTLATVEEAISGGTGVPSDNLYAHESVLYIGGPSAIIADLAKLPPTVIDEDRVVQVGDEPPFVQRVVFDDSTRATVELTGTADGNSLISRQVWLAGGKWWSEATRTMGDRVLISGRLLTP